MHKHYTCKISTKQYLSSPVLQSSAVVKQEIHTQVRSKKKNNNTNNTTTSSSSNCTPWKANVSKQINFAPKHVEYKLIKKNWKLFSAKYLLLFEQSFSIPDQTHPTPPSAAQYTARHPLPFSVSGAPLLHSRFRWTQSMYTIHMKYIFCCAENILHRKYFCSMEVCLCAGRFIPPKTLLKRKHSPIAAHREIKRNLITLSRIPCSYI